MKLRSSCHPEAAGRKPQSGDTAWTLRIPLESGETLELEVGQKGRDLLFGMMIADCHDSKESEPVAQAKTTFEEVGRMYLDLQARNDKLRMAVASVLGQRVEETQEWAAFGRYVKAVLAEASK